MPAENSKRTAFVSTKGAVILLVGMAILLEMISWPIKGADPLSLAVEGSLSVLALACAFGGMLVVIIRLSTSARLKIIIVLACFLLLTSEVLNSTGKFPVLAEVPFLGSESLVHGWVEKIGQICGIMIFIVGLSLALWEVHISSNALKTATEGLRRSEANFRVLAETTAAATFIHKGGRFLYVNRALSEMSGYSIPELLDMDYWEVLSPESREEVQKRGAARLGGDSPPSRYEISVFTKNQEKRYCDLTVALANFQGETSVLGAFFDITDRKHAEETLARERDLLKIIIDNMPDYIYFKDAESRFVVGNVAILHQLGTTKLEDIVGRTDFDFFPREMAEKYYKDEQRIVRSKKPLLSEEEMTRDLQGREQILLTTKVPMTDSSGDVVGIVGIGRDITKLKNVQDALRSREHFLTSIFASIQDGISVLDTDMNVVRTNPAMECWHADSMPIVGKKCYEAYHNRKTPCEICPTLTAMKTGKGAFEVVPKRGPDGGIIQWLDLHSFPMLDQDSGKITGVIEYVRDVTEQKSLENQLRHAQKLESLGVLAGGIAHDFNNLLVGMQGYAGLALMKLLEESPARSYVEKIEAGARRAAELTNQMLAYSGKGAFVKQPLDISKLVQDVGRLVAASISKKATVKYNCPQGLPQIVGDPTQLHQVVMNLVINASDSLDDRQGAIALTTGAVRVDEEYLANTYINDALPDGEYISLEISDTGCGMDRETVARIFDPFFSTKFAGRGLGLAAVLGIVRGHKGAIKVYSEVGHGTTFKILLPAEDVGKHSHEPAPPKQRRALDGYKGHGLILVADDEETVRNVTKEVLTTFGFTVIMAENGRQAIEMFKANEAKLTAVILDLTMPIMSGHEVFQEIRKTSSTVPVILSSGYTEQDVSEKFSDARPAGFIQKPYVHTELVSKLRSVIKPRTTS